MSVSSPDVIELESLDEAWAIPCDYNSNRRIIDKSHTLHDVSGGGSQPARWVISIRCPHCGNSSHALACDACKDFITATQDGVGCAGCGKTIVPYRKVIARVEPLERGAA
jgi:hypothetical protein